MYRHRAILSIGHNPRLLSQRHVLLTQAGYSVTSAAVPVKAMDLLSTRNFDVVVVGLKAHAEKVLIERHKNEGNVPVIFLCCDRFDPIAGVCTCHNAHLSCEELLQTIAATVSSDETP